MKKDPSEIDLSGEDMLGITRKLTGEEKILLACKVREIVDDKLRLYIQDIHPEWEKREVQREFFRFFHGEELASKVFDQNREPREL